jgi:hypothetical protein
MHAKTLPARHGVLWLLGGYALFRRNPPLMTALTFSYLMVVIVINLIPAIGPFLLPLFLPALTAMLGNGCRAVEQGRTAANQIGELLTEGLSQQREGLMRLGALHLLGSALLVLASFGLGEKIELNDGMTPEEATQLATDMGLMLLMASPLLMAFWFAPLLTAWGDVPAGKAIFFSFVASWRNWRPFAMYGLALGVVGVMAPGLILVIAGLLSPVVLSVLSVVMRMMLLFVLAPTLVASVYLSYRDVFSPVAPATPAIPVAPTSPATPVDE